MEKGISGIETGFRQRLHDLDQVGFGGIETEKDVHNIKEVVALMKEEKIRLIVSTDSN